MSDCFFRRLEIPEPDFHMGIGSGSHGEQTGAMLKGIESVLESWPADGVITYGDTNSTVAAALAAAKLHVPVVHLEAGLRSFNRRMPEELNRVATDHLSDVLLCPTEMALLNARREGLDEKSWLTGDVMLDLLLKHADTPNRHASAGEDYALITVHRAENTDDSNRMAKFLRILERLPLKAILPMHPRLRAKLGPDLARVERLSHVELLEPCEYAEMVALQRDARVVLTDSGGVQKEAYFLGVPCLTLRDETEWLETLAGGWNRLIGMDPDAALQAIDSLLCRNGFVPREKPNLALFGSGTSGELSVETILKTLRRAA
jgi:UDP-GlcNAc3NAcA epimerase